MTTNAAQYLDNADACERMASTVDDEEAKEAYLRCADRWRQMALDNEALESANKAWTELAGSFVLNGP